MDNKYKDYFDIIFADEPTGNLDAGSAKTVAEMLSKASQNFGRSSILTKLLSN